MASSVARTLRSLAITTFALPILGIWWRPVVDARQFAWNVLLTYAVLLVNVLLLARGSARIWVFRCFAIQVAILLAWFVLEAGAAMGIVDYRLTFGTLGDEPWRNPLNRLDPELLHLHAPRQRLVGVQKGGDIAYHFRVPHPGNYPYDVQYDHNGFRNDADLANAEIVILGDSMIEATSVPREETFAALLAEKQQCTVANLGQLWYGPIQEWIVLKRFGIPLKPRVCLWAFFAGNDLSDLRRYQSAIQDWPMNSASFHSFPARSFAKNGLQAAFQRWGYPRRPDALSRAADFRAPDGTVTRLYMYYPEPPMTPENLHSLGIVDGIFREAWELLQDHGVSLVVMYIPTKFRVYHDLCTFPKGSECASWQLSDLPERLKEMLASLSPDIHFLDLTDALKDRARSGAIVYWPDDTHWTPAGNRAAADAIQPFLEERHLLARSQGTP